MAVDLGERDEFQLDAVERGRGLARVRAGRGGELAAFGVGLVGADLDDQRHGARAAPGCRPRPRSRWRWSWRCSRSPARRSPTGWSWRGCARGSRTIGWARRPGCSTRSPRCSASADRALRIDFRSLEVRPVALSLGDCRLVTLDSGEEHTHAGSGYNERRAECAEACRAARGRQPARRERSRWLGSLPAPLVAARPPRGHRERPGRRGGGGARHPATWTSSGGCSTPRTPACATVTRSRRRRSRPRCSGASARARSGRGSWAAGSAAACSPCCRRRFAPRGAVEVRPGARGGGVGGRDAGGRARRRWGGARRRGRGGAGGRCGRARGRRREPRWSAAPRSVGRPGRRRGARLRHLDRVRVAGARAHPRRTRGSRSSAR